MTVLYFLVLMNNQCHFFVSRKWKKNNTAMDTSISPLRQNLNYVRNGCTISYSNGPLERTIGKIKKASCERMLFMQKLFINTIWQRVKSISVFQYYYLLWFWLVYVVDSSRNSSSSGSAPTRLSASNPAIWFISSGVRSKW